MLARIDSFQIVGPFRLDIRFGDGSGGVHDFQSLAVKGGGLAEALRDRAFFDRAFLDFGALTWPNGFDISPEWLRREMIGAAELRHAAAAE
jgi:Protein of unknown function (DUF2442)